MKRGPPRRKYSAWAPDGVTVVPLRSKGIVRDWSNKEKGAKSAQVRLARRAARKEGV